MKNKSSGPSRKKEKPQEAIGEENGGKNSRPSKAIAFGMILAVSISVAIGCDSQNNPGPQPPEPPGPAASDDEIPVELESYWDLQKESNCSSSKVKVPSGYAALICNISDINMINLFVFSWEPVKQANKRNGAKYKTLYHEVYFVPIDYRWVFGSKSDIVGINGKINLTNGQLLSLINPYFQHAIQGATDVFYIGLASREGNLQEEEERYILRARTLHKAFQDLIPNPKKTNEYGLSFGKYDDNKCPASDDSSEERPVIIAMISGSGKEEAMSIYKSLLKQKLEDDVEKIISEIWKDLNNNSSSGSKFVKPSCYSRGENPEILMFRLN